MKIYIYPKPIPYQEKELLYMVEGLKRHNIIPKICNNFNPLDIPDLAIFWAHKRDDIIYHMKKHNKPYMVMERGYIGDRFHWTSCGFNGLNGRADFCNEDIKDSYRWDKHFKQYMSEDYIDTSNRSHALVAGQVIGDAALKHVDINRWYIDRIRELNSLGIPVIFREHPQSRLRFIDNSVKYRLDTHVNLEDSLKTAKFTVTFSSNSGVVSILKGIPTLSYDEGSMVYNITDHNVNLIRTRDRQEWANKIAWTQWCPDEIKSGETWNHLKQKFN